jgi:hypothetical protein
MIVNKGEKLKKKNNNKILVYTFVCVEERCPGLFQRHLCFARQTLKITHLLASPPYVRTFFVIRDAGNVKRMYFCKNK